MNDVEGSASPDCDPEPPPSAGGRIRARPAGLLNSTTRRPVFRIEDPQGQVLRRISTARDAHEAIVHYWRATAADVRFSGVMSDEPAEDALRRRIARARRTGGRAAMLTHELPLPEPEPAHEPKPVEAAPAPAGAAAMRPPRAIRQRLVETDLFAALDAPADEPAPVEAKALIREPEREPAAPADPVVEPGPTSAASRPRTRTAYHLDPRTVSMQPVDHRNLRPTDRADSYLYHIIQRPEAATTMAVGLVVNPQDPIILTERQGVAYWLAALADDFDVILDGPADFVVLRVRRFAIEAMLETDPDASRSAGCACYLLTGGAASDD